jgi:hypothetical protein
LKARINGQVWGKDEIVSSQKIGREAVNHRSDALHLPINRIENEREILITD